MSLKINSERVNSLALNVKNQLIDLYLSGGIYEQLVIGQKIEFLVPTAELGVVYICERTRVYSYAPKGVDRAIVELIKAVIKDRPESNVINLHDAEDDSTGSLTLSIYYQTVGLTYTLPNSVELMSYVIKNEQ